MSYDTNNPEEIFEDQEDFDEIVEIDEKGNVYSKNKAPRSYNKKPSILRDPEGEY
jgi:hypothetical protein